MVKMRADTPGGRWRLAFFYLWLILLISLTACRVQDEDVAARPEPGVTVTAVQQEGEQSRAAEGSPGLSAAEIASLDSLTKVDDHPLYTMTYYGSYGEPRTVFAGDYMAARERELEASMEGEWACSLFAALGDPEGALFGRNFDWRHSPALFLHTDPDDGYASVSMVDIEYLGFDGELAHDIDRLPLEERQDLLIAPWIPFDGMNELGLVVGMAAVPPGGVQPDPAKRDMGSLGVIREILDHAGSVDEAIDIFSQFNIDMGEGPPLHYLVADVYGQSALVEFFEGQMVVIPNHQPWHRATNFLRSAYGDQADGICARYDTLGSRLEEEGGAMRPGEALELLRTVAQTSTQWSIVYGMADGEVLLVMDRHFDAIHTFALDMEKRR